jgi:hypothetical protein
MDPHGSIYGTTGSREEQIVTADSDCDEAGVTLGHADNADQMW